MASMKAETLSKTSRDQSTQLYFIGNALCVPNHSFHIQVYTDLKLIGKCNYIFNICGIPNHKLLQ